MPQPSRSPSPSSPATGCSELAALIRRYGCGPIAFTGERDALYERHLLFDAVIGVDEAGPRERFEAAARSVRDVLSQLWVLCEKTYAERRAKRIYYLSMEFLIGRSLGSNLLNLGLTPLLERETSERQLAWAELLEQEPDAGLGNGGLGRLAACYLESMASLDLPAMGYGLRYEYGMFRQELREGRQHERPDHWLERVDPWEVARPQERIEIDLPCSFEVREGALAIVRGKPSRLYGVPYDRPVVGHGGRTIATLRLFTAVSGEGFDFGDFSSGDFVGALAGTLAAESLTRVLYPDDSTTQGRMLRFVQEFFLVACALRDLVRRFRRGGEPWSALPDRAAIQMNDTHPALAVPELLRLLLDEAGLGWDEAWDLTRRTLAYTNHTLLPEALEKWPVTWLEMLIPRHLELLYEINRRFLDEVRGRFHGDEARVARASLFEEEPTKQVRMAHVACVGSQHTNGVAAIHSELLRTRTLRDLAEIFPDRFLNVTNGITPRRWLALANPGLARVVTEAIGPRWIEDLSELAKLRPLAERSALRASFHAAKAEAKQRFAAWLVERGGPALDPESIFDAQVKRLHEYKRQLLNALRIAALYAELRAAPDREVVPRVFLFAGKAAPAYRAAKAILALLVDLGRRLDDDPAVRGRLRAVFLPNYSVTLAERLIPASEISNQISTAGYEASGTSNMKFQLNGAATLGTRDGATIEIAEEVGEAEMFLFGLSAAEVEASAASYVARAIYESRPRVRAAFDLLFGEAGAAVREDAALLRASLLEQGDRYRLLADLESYLDADAALLARYADRDAWATTALRNIAGAGKFSSDRSIAEYARRIWGVEPCRVR
jgi:starch phosphorylase